MSITLKNVSKSYDSRTVLSDVNVTFTNHDRTVLVGENGSGKTTLLKICAQKEEIDSGTVSYESRGRVIYIAQEFDTKAYGKMTALEYISQGDGERSLPAVKTILKSFDFDHKLLSLNMEGLSGGQQKIIQLAIAFALRPAYLLIDEPENHLDIFARQTLITEMSTFRGCLLFVSHDHELINAVANKIVEIENETIHSYTGSYEFYLEQKNLKEQALERDHKAHERKLTQLDTLIKRLQVWVQKNPGFGKQLRARATQLKRLENNAPQAKSKKNKAKLTIKQSDHTAKRIFLAEKLGVELTGKMILENINLSLFATDQVALVGRNGSGKSTFLKTICSKIPATTGTLRLHPTLNIGYFSQDTIVTLDEEATPFEVLTETRKRSEHEVRAILAQYLIDAEACKRKIKTLSGGQKTRLRFCLLFSKPSDILILDEPTNHLDPVTWEVLIDAIKQHTGALLIVSHDRLFLEQLNLRLWVCEKRTVKEYHGHLADYLHQV